MIHNDIIIHSSICLPTSWLTIEVSITIHDYPLSIALSICLSVLITNMIHSSITKHYETLSSTMISNYETWMFIINGDDLLSTHYEPIDVAYPWCFHVLSMTFPWFSTDFPWFSMAHHLCFLQHFVSWSTRRLDLQAIQLQWSGGRRSRRVAGRVSGWSSTTRNWLQSQ